MFLIRRRSRILRKHDFETEQKRYVEHKEDFFIKGLTPTFEAESTGERVTLFGGRKVGELSLEISLLRKTNDEKLSCGMIKSEKMCRHPVRKHWNLQFPEDLL